MTDAPKNIHQRIAEVMKAVTYIQKERKEGMRYTIVSHDTVTAKCRPALLDAGVIYYPTRCDHTQNGNRAECSMTMRFANIDDPTDFIEVQTFGYGVDTQDKGPGKAMSYAVKYALLKTLGLETGDDADHDSIPHETRDPQVHQAAVQSAVTGIENEPDIEGLSALYADLYRNQRDVATDPKVVEAKDKRKAFFEAQQQREAA